LKYIVPAKKQWQMELENWLSYWRKRRRHVLSDHRLRIHLTQDRHFQLHRIMQVHMKVLVRHDLSFQFPGSVLRAICTLSNDACKILYFINVLIGKCCVDEEDGVGGVGDKMSSVALSASKSSVPYESRKSSVVEVDIRYGRQFPLS
jgi:hypothetical protein